MTTTLSSKGQIVLPKAIRTSHNWTVGTEFTVEEAQGCLLLRPIRRTSNTATTLDDVVGCTNYTGPARSQAEMDAGIAREARRVWAKSKRSRS